MELIMTIICYLTVIGCVWLLPFLLFAALRYGADRSRKCALGSACILLVTILLCGCVLYVRPISYCPKPYQSAVSDNWGDRLTAGQLPAESGFWSAKAPFLAIINEVTYADEYTLHVRTWWFPFGRSEIGVNSDGLYPITSALH